MFPLILKNISNNNKVHKREVIIRMAFCLVLVFVIIEILTKILFFERLLRRIYK